MDIWEEFIDDARRELPDILRNLNGAAANENKKLSTRYTPEVEMGAQSHGFDLAKELVSALNQEMRAETIQDLLSKAHAVALVSGTIQPGGPATFTDVVLKIHQNAAMLDRDSIIIVSPTMLTIIQAEGSGIFERLPEKERNVPAKTGGLTKIGMLERFPVYCDAYGHDTVPVLIAAPGWFSYSSGDTLSAKKTIDLATNETIITFETDVQLKVNPIDVRQLKVEVAGLRFFG